MDANRFRHAAALSLERVVVTRDREQTTHELADVGIDPHQVVPDVHNVLVVEEAKPARRHADRGQSIEKNRAFLARQSSWSGDHEPLEDDIAAPLGDELRGRIDPEGELGDAERANPGDPDFSVACEDEPAASAAAGDREMDRTPLVVDGQILIEVVLPGQEAETDVGDPLGQQVVDRVLDRTEPASRAAHGNLASAPALALAEVIE